MRIAVVNWNPAGGIETIYRRLVGGLRNLNYRVDTYEYMNGYTRAFLKSIINLKRYKGYDVVINMGSIPIPIYARFLKLLFIHGFTNYELSRDLANSIGSPAKVYGDIVQLASFNILTGIPLFNYYICHSHMTCEINNIDYNRRIILPQFLLKDEKPLYDKLRMKSYIDKKYDVTIYLSHAYSPKLLGINQIFKIFVITGRRINRRLKIMVIDPNGRIHGLSNEYIRVKTYVFFPKNIFYEKLLETKLFFESSIDEELRYSAIEAGAMGIPVAKYTLPERIKYTDYTEDQIIHDSSMNKLIDRLSEYFKGYGGYEYYSKRIYDFVWNKRVWNKVSKELLKRFKSSINQ